MINTICNLFSSSKRLIKLNEIVQLICYVELLFWMRDQFITFQHNYKGTSTNVKYSE